LHQLRFDDWRKDRKLPEVRSETAACSRPGGPLNSGREKSNCSRALFAIFLGAFGIHQFYVGHVGQGILYLIFCWTIIPALISYVEGLTYLMMSDQDFEELYSRK
jgi:TM2 domain-containing membrane protein YozV